MYLTFALKGSRAGGFISSWGGNDASRDGEHKDSRKELSQAYTVMGASRRFDESSEWLEKVRKNGNCIRLIVIISQKEYILKYCTFLVISVQIIKVVAVFLRCFKRPKRSLKFFQRPLKIRLKLGLLPPSKNTKTYDHLGTRIKNCGLSHCLSDQQGQPLKPGCYSIMLQ